MKPIQWPAIAAPVVWFLACRSHPAQAVIIPYAPDAWVRGNTPNSSFFGWDVLEFAGAPNAPFGSYKASGVGRQNGTEGFLQYLETKTIAVGIQ